MLSTSFHGQLNYFTILMNKDGKFIHFLVCLLGFFSFLVRLPAGLLINCIDFHPFANFSFTGAKIKHSFFMLSYKQVALFLLFSSYMYFICNLISSLPECLEHLLLIYYLTEAC